MQWVPPVSLLEVPGNEESDALLQQVEREQHQLFAASALCGAAEGLRKYPARKKQEPSAAPSVSAVELIFLDLVSVL